MNAPIDEPFAQQSPYVLHRRAARLAIVDERNGYRYAGAHSRRSRPGTSGRHPAARRCRAIGVLQGTYLGIYINPVCEFWKSSDLNCRFCTTGENVGGAEAAAKTIEDVVETCRAAKAESGITFVHLNGGFQGGRALELRRTVRARDQEGSRPARRRAAHPGTPVVALRPPDRRRRGPLFVLRGAARPGVVLSYLPRQGALARPGPVLRRDDLLRGRLPRGAVSGELIAGIEPIANTIAGIERITSAGAFPTVCIFRPTAGSGMADWPSPEYHDMRMVMAAVYDACRRHRIPIGSRRTSR